MISLSQTVRILALVVWVGGLIFFAFVLAPVAFRTLPTTREAGLVVGAALRVLHLLGFVAGVVYLLASLVKRGSRPRWLAPALVTAMLSLTAWSQWSILPRMERNRAAIGGSLETTGPHNASRADFDRLHKQSEQVEGGVLLLGLAVVILTGWDPEQTTALDQNVRITEP